MKKLRFLLIMLLLSSLIACSNECYLGRMRGWGNMMYYGGGMYMGMLFIIIIAVVLIYFVVQTAKPKDTIGSSGDTPLDILKKRYAKGEITKDEFDRMKRDIES
ncbi:MAG: SHOCT domain-containing protein [Syntrophales bacterium]|jgi:putative membrane protein